ncbi:hypothetical protein [Bradyrhizobium elkanii]|uniref:Transposase n=1 Tax=Bradyrhizobium elkanii TaxID=29448 RepID=A0ABV4FA93_BRAEL|nr:hypothetical protein [Bradyrhizobium elkanii]MCP1751954.1 hypothetical protein [Bradyrhizobium elkanii]MCP1977725.1 hypothetical protein [Bradyrhizobium elkanii]MCS3887758.1 hypothetical protein [Bradyrhizobium elkanii]MCS4213223.1 hypothetical protein [Bradyrhizobium elkanii]MCW2213530.1 hypothetical protein [Bradyrhizobium elkanii]
MERLQRIKELLDQQEKIGIELTALREQATQELEAFSTAKRKRRTKAEITAQEKKSGTDTGVEQ